MSGPGANLNQINLIRLLSRRLAPIPALAAIALRHPHRLDRLAVAHPHQVALGAVDGLRRLHNLRPPHGVAPGHQLLPQRQRQHGHLLYRLYPPAVERFKHLRRPVLRQAKLRRQRLQLRQRLAEQYPLDI